MLKTGGEIPKLQNGKYIVKKGDTFSKIAKTHGITLSELVKFNSNIKNINRINIGQEINLGIVI